MPPIAVINSATGVSAARLAIPEKIGRIAAGYRSRLIFLRHDPLKSVANLHREKTVLFDGTQVQCPDRLDPSGL
jgi:imidazolonepropionase-like amidohydrolase